MGPELLGRLMDAHAAALVLFARQWCSIPEDIVQEAFLKLATQTKPPEHPVAWLYSVVRNAAISAGRAAQRRHKHESRAAAQTPTWFIPAESAGLDGETATAALRELPLSQREVIVAHIWGGLTFEQIAELTGTSASTAYRWYDAGLLVIRERLGEPCPAKPETPR